MISDKLLQTRLLFFILVLILSRLPLFAQELTVKSMQLLSNDVTAMTNQRQDLNGEYAGIVKVQLAVDGAKFEGNVIEQTKHETGEYWVWLAKDTKRMKIYAPGYLPLELNFFRSYDIKIEPKRTYQLVVASSSVVAPQSDNKGFLAFDVEPKNATLSIDGSKVGLLDGQYSNLVQQGSYEYEVTADGYESQRGRVQVTDQTQPVIVRLQSLMSTLQVSCATADAEIYLDGQLRGKAPQTLTLLKGSHRVEARLEGYRSFREDISVSEKESRRLDIPSLTRLTGSLRVNYMPLGSDVYVDGKKLGVTPGTFREVAVGNRKVEVRKDGYTTANVNAEVMEDEICEITGQLNTSVKEKTPIQMYRIANDYYNGENGRSKDYSEAANWYLKAAEQGYAEAQTTLGLMYYKGLGVSQDYLEAVKWYRKAAEQGYAIAQFNLGLMYNKGRGVSQDYSEAVKWYRKAAEQGIAEAQNSVGTSYQEGRGVSQDYLEAVKWYRKAAEQGFAIAQSNLGLMYEYGLGVSQNYSEAIKWYRKAAAQGIKFAEKRLKELTGN